MKQHISMIVVEFVVSVIAISIVALTISTDSLLTVQAFTSPSQLWTSTTTTISSTGSRQQRHLHPLVRTNHQFRIVSSTTTVQLAATSISIPNPLKQLPWNVQKDREREVRRNQLERSKIYRQIGIAEDATYEEIVEATDRLIQLAGPNNLKRTIQIEIMKDQILQHRLNERLNGLLVKERTTNKEARAMSNYEMEGIDEDDLPKTAKEWNAPLWTKGLIVKPDTTQIQNQLRLWGIITVLGIALPPVQEYLGRFTWLICIAQLTFRGMPKQDMDGGGMGMSFNNGRGGGHRKVAFALGFTTWMIGAVIAYGLMPSWARGQRWTNSMAFSIQNLIFGLASCYLQPYKG